MYITAEICQFPSTSTTCSNNQNSKKRKTAEQLTGIGEIKIKQVLKKEMFLFNKNDTLEMLQQMQAKQYKALKFLEHHVCSLITSHLTNKTGG